MNERVLDCVSYAFEKVRRIRNYDYYRYISELSRKMCSIKEGD